MNGKTEQLFAITGDMRKQEEDKANVKRSYLLNIHTNIYKYKHKLKN